jgi:hypothetical protein
VLHGLLLSPYRAADVQQDGQMRKQNSAGEKYHPR